jgi:hypothetical protein
MFADASGAASVATFKSCLFKNNEALSAGAFYLNSPTSSVTIEGSLLQGNAGASAGSAILCRNCQRLWILGSILAENTCLSGGGAIFLELSGDVRLISTTFVGNTAPMSPSALLASNPLSPVVVTNTIFSGPNDRNLIMYIRAADLAVTYSAWRGCTGLSNCGVGVIDADVALTKTSITLPAGTLGPDAYWTPDLASPTVNSGDATGSGTVDFIGNPRVRELWRRGEGRYSWAGDSRPAIQIECLAVWRFKACMQGTRVRRTAV